MYCLEKKSRADVSSRAGISKGRRSVTGYNHSTATVMRALNDMGYAAATLERAGFDVSEIFKRGIY